jgi:spermidine synthase
VTTRPRPTPLRAAAFALFVVSGACGLVYQIVWLRLAFAAFGIVTPVLSILLSAFMAGLALGSWLGGRAGAALARRGGAGAVIGYGLVELAIAGGAVAVPWLFAAGEHALLATGDASSGGYLASSAAWIAAAILPFATLMGATFPLMMAWLRAHEPAATTTFSFLYLANVIGAMVGAAGAALVLVELLGFRASLLVAAAGNVAIGVAALLLPRLARGASAAAATQAPSPAAALHVAPPSRSRVARLALLFATGAVSMAMEVAWTRAFTPVLQTTIYAFAAVLTVYLAATWIGSAVYRRHLQSDRAARPDVLLALLFPAALLPLLCNDPRLHDSAIVVLLSIAPVSALLGYLTPQLVDDHARGEPRGAGAAYALNVLGCIAGPLAAGYVLLPLLGVQWTLLASAAVFPAFGIALRAPDAPALVRATTWLGVATLLATVLLTRTHEDPAGYANAEVRRDHVATVVSHGADRQKRLLVNGVGITELTDLTKVMAHLPLAVRERPPASTLVICFGMGTTFRSLASWGGRTTAVELVPSVADAFGFYFADAADVRARPGARIVIDDGRRFLKRTTERFDLITIDPPPPVEAGGSSLLYSAEFYRVLRPRLSPTGLLAQWFPGGEDTILRAVVNTVVREFPHVVAFRAFEAPTGSRVADAGVHLLAAEWPITVPAIAAVIARMPDAAKRDLLEWHPEMPIELAWDFVLKQRIDVAELLPGNPRLGITDDRPFNEYFWLRRTLGASDLLTTTLPAAAR